MSFIPRCASAAASAGVSVPFPNPWEQESGGPRCPRKASALPTSRLAGKPKVPDPNSIFNAPSPPMFYIIPSSGHSEFLSAGLIVCLLPGSAGEPTEQARNESHKTTADRFKNLFSCAELREGRVINEDYEEKVLSSRLISMGV